MVGRARSRIGPAVVVLALVGTLVAVVGLGLGRGAAVTHAGPTSSTTVATAAPGGRAVRIVGLGDSVTAGTGCRCADYVTGVGRLLAARDHRAVDADNEGDPGATTSDLLDDLTHDRRTRTAVSSADVVVVTIGANDLTPALASWHDTGCDPDCYAPQVAAMGKRLDQILAAIDADHRGRAPTVLVTGYWNVFRDGDVGRRAEGEGYLGWSDTVTRAANAAICRSAAAADARCVDLYTPFKRDGGADPTALLAADGDHPDAAGTALISRTVLAALDG